MIIEESAHGFRVRVPCKINLFLDVLGKRTDGYHSLDTVMMAVSLVDELEITHRDDDQLNLSIEFPEGYGHALDGDDLAWNIPADQTNLVLRALMRLRHALGKPDSGADIKLIKRIPAMAGLGGGSADAAAALVLGTLLWSQGNLVQASTIASELGSDINFFLESHCNGHWTARCTGRGEQIEVLECLEPLHFVLVHPPRGCSTKEVFAALNLSQNQPRTPQSLIQGLAQNNLQTIGGGLFNRLEEAANRTTNWIERSRRQIDRYDHHGQCLSGSGSARFCLCGTQAEAEKIAREIQAQGEIRAYCATSWQSPGIEEQIARLRNNA